MAASIHCSQCHNLLTSQWALQAERFRLKCPACGALCDDPYPALPIIKWEPVLGGRKRGRAAYFVAFVAVVCVIIGSLFLLKQRTEKRVTPHARKRSAADDELRALHTPLDQSRQPPAAQPAPVSPKPSPRPDAPAIARPPTPSKRPPVPSMPSRGRAGPPSAARPPGRARPHGAGERALVIRPIVFSGLPPVRCLASCAQDRILASGHSDGTIRLWDLDSVPAEDRVIRSEAGPPLSVAFTPGGKQLAALTSHKVDFYSLPGCEKVGSIESGQALSSFAFSSQGECLATAQKAGRVIIRAMSTLHIVNRIPGYGGAQCVAWRGATRELIVASADNAVRVWDTDDVTGPHVLIGHDDWVSALATTRDGLVTGSWDMTVRMWRLAGKGKPRVLRGHASKVTAVAATEDADAIASGDDRGVVRIWDGPSGMEMAAIRAHTGRISGIVFVTREWIITAAEDGSARAWRMSAATDGYMTELLSRSTDADTERPALTQYAQLVDEANRFMRERRYEQAIERQRKAVKCRPGYAEAHLFLAESLHAAGQSADAVASYRQAAKLQPDSGWIWYRLGVVLLEADSTDIAADVLERACALLPGLVDARISLGQALLKAKRHEEARQAFETALAALPRSHRAHRGLGLSYAGLQQWQNAVDELRKAIDIKRDYTPAYSDLIDTLLASGTGRAKEAEGWARLAASVGVELRAATRERLKARTR